MHSALLIICFFARTNTALTCFAAVIAAPLGHPARTGPPVPGLRRDNRGGEPLSDPDLCSPSYLWSGVSHHRDQIDDPGERSVSDRIEWTVGSAASGLGQACRIRRKADGVGRHMVQHGAEFPYQYQSTRFHRQ